MPIRAKLTTRDEGGSTDQAGSNRGTKREHSEEEKATRKTRVAAAKDALARSNGLKGDHVVAARAALKAYLRNLNESRQPDDESFQALVEAPFRAPPKKREQRDRR